jgi:hypothetical protein
MKCWVCAREARGYGHTDLRFGMADPRRYPLDWAFCSRRCQDAFHRLYSLRVETEKRGQEVSMIDASEVERAAMQQCLKAFGSAAEAIGFGKPLGAYSEAEALQVIDAIVTRYTEAMVAHHEAMAQPPVRGLAHPVRDSFLDIESDLPWEAKP